jgi:hypothetical protein
VFAALAGPITQTIVAMVTVFIFYLLQLKFSPARVEVLNRLDEFSMLSLTVTFMLGQLLWAQDDAAIEDDVYPLLVSLLLVLVQVSYLTFWLYSFSTSAWQAAKEKTQTLDSSAMLARLSGSFAWLRSSTQTFGDRTNAPRIPRESASADEQDDPGLDSRTVGRNNVEMRRLLRPTDRGIEQQQLYGVC